MRLARGTDIDQVAGTLDDVVRTLQDLGRSPYRQDYLCWVEDSETALCGVFLEPDVAARLYTARFWRLYDGDYDIDQADVTRPIPDLCVQEAAAHLAYLTALAAQVERLRALAASPGHILVYDTNSLMHYQPPGAIPWDTVAKVTAARLVVPLVVIDELDAKKYAGSEKMAKRAAGALRELDQILDGAQPGTPVALPNRAGVSVESCSRGRTHPSGQRRRGDHRPSRPSRTTGRQAGHPGDRRHRDAASRPGRSAGNAPASRPVQQGPVTWTTYRRPCSWPTTWSG